MRALRIAAFLIVAISLMAGTTAVAGGASTEQIGSIREVAGSVDVHRVPGGTFDVMDRVFQYRSFPVAGSGDQLTDPRLSGAFTSDWNWDVLASGGQPVPAWGHITIDGPDGTWQGEFTGIRPADFEPVAVRALLFGDGAYEGLCATLDIAAVGLADANTWVLDGVVHPVAIEV
jgi:hypothetical protein